MIFYGSLRKAIVAFRLMWFMQAEFLSCSWWIVRKQHANGADHNKFL